MSRSAWKPLFIHPLLREKQTTMAVNLQNRATTIIKKIVGKTFNIYNGITWYSIQVTEEMKGQSFGQFASTRYRSIQKYKNKK